MFLYVCYSGTGFYICSFENDVEQVRYYREEETRKTSFIFHVMGV